jgi:replicative DNA helicase
MNKPRLYDDLGKLPPQDIAIEKCVLGALLLASMSPECKRLLDIIQPEHFYNDGHREIADALLKINESGTVIDLRLVVHHLRKVGKLEIVGGSYYLAELMSIVSSTVNIEEHYRILIELWMRRELILLAGNIMGSVYDLSNNVFTIVDATAASLQKINPYSENE